MLLLTPLQIVNSLAEYILTCMKINVCGCLEVVSALVDIFD